ncbi:MAG: PBP1A family penicillin-binding protein [Termitinemataceae bacterium]|nr:MAG: PBP1A family penicillin-binding protein [Termitinemataceae bacterium]
MSKRKGSIFVRIIGGITIFAVIVVGALLGLALAETTSIINFENFDDFSPALPTKVLDINGTLITEYAADEKREMISVYELPRHLIYAVLAREDPDFYKHRGFTIKAITRAFVGKITGNSRGGGSTISQQVAGTLHTNRSEYTISRKVRELWWAIQMERQYTKNEILEIYLNYMYMGPGVYGVEAASKYFFGHSAREITLAESAVLVVQLSAPTRYNPIANPNEAMDRQTYVLNKMVDLGYTTREEADASFDEYWAGYDWTRVSQAAYFHRDDKAPWFSEYVRRELDGMMYQRMDYYRDGYTVHTTLDLSMQEVADRLMTNGINRANVEYKRSSGTRLNSAERATIPIINLLSLSFSINMLRGTSAGQNEVRSINRYTKTINPIVDLAAATFGIDGLKEISKAGFDELKNSSEQNVVEGALIILENNTGYIKAIVGGSKYDQNNQLIRATQGRVMPGSSFKPLYYSAAIDSGKFMPSSLIYDSPVVFHNEDGTPYIPLNFRGEWKGTVLLYDALAQSMNVPSLKVLDGIGFDAAINRAASLLGIDDPEAKRRTFPRVFPMGLGIISIAPIRMARAFSIFANEGREVSPLAVLSVEDRNGRIVIDAERDLRLKERQKGNNIQVISPQTAFVMTGLLKKTVEIGTLGGQGQKFIYVDKEGKRYRIAAAGKTGTTQNWSDAWTVGFTPYYTTAIWFGFDMPGNSLGLTLTGATLAGPIWGDFMREIHKGLPAKEFVRPESGVVDITVCAKSGQLLTSSCNQGAVTLTHLSKYRPVEYCSYHRNAGERAAETLDKYKTIIRSYSDEDLTSDLGMPTLDFDFSVPANRSTTGTSGAAGGADKQSGDQSTQTGTTDTKTNSLPNLDDLEMPAYNPLTE